eukprot:4891228-Pyramimonas_sp.AAC.1
MRTKTTHTIIEHDKTSSTDMINPLCGGLAAAGCRAGRLGPGRLRPPRQCSRRGNITTGGV